MGSDEPVVGSSEVRRLEERVRELERMLGRKTMEVEVARSHLHEKVHRLAKPRGYYRKPDDLDLLPLVRRLIDERPTYGYRRITALANRERWHRQVNNLRSSEGLEAGGAPRA